MYLLENVMIQAVFLKENGIGKSPIFGRINKKAAFFKESGRICLLIWEASIIAGYKQRVFWDFYRFVVIFFCFISKKDPLHFSHVSAF